MSGTDNAFARLFFLTAAFLHFTLFLFSALLSCGNGRKDRAVLLLRRFPLRQSLALRGGFKLEPRARSSWPCFLSGLAFISKPRGFSSSCAKRKLLRRHFIRFDGAGSHYSHRSVANPKQILLPTLLPVTSDHLFVLTARKRRLKLRRQYMTVSVNSGL